jgi:hypothetical protein
MNDNLGLGIDYAVDVVQAVLAQPIGVTTGFFEKRLTRLGDRAAVALLKLYNDEDWSNRPSVGRALGIIQVAMRAPHVITARYDQSPDVSILLLRTILENVGDDDARLIKETIEVLAARRAQLNKKSE